MPFRILCLHGSGTNSAIFESQTVGFRTLLPKDWEWHFVEAEEDSPAPPGIESIYPGPYLTYYTDPSLESIKAALGLIDDVVEQEGPFDGIMGFSQGGAFAASAILRRQIELPFEQPQFRFAIFLCATLPFSWAAEYGHDVTWLMVHMQDLTGDFSVWERAGKRPVQLTQAVVDAQPPGPKQQLQSMLDAGLDVPVMQRFHPRATSVRIDIPTVHVYGAHDPFREQGIQTLALCDTSLSWSVEHAEGHSIPKNVSKRIADAIEKAVKRAELMI